MNTLEQYTTVVAINVDVQNDFCPGGSLAVPEGNQVINPLNRVNRWVRDQSGVAIFTRDWHPERTTHFDNWPVHCVQNKKGAAFHDDLKIWNGQEFFSGAGSDLIISKGMGSTEDAYSGFEAYGTITEHDRWGGGGTVPAQLGDILSSYLRGRYTETIRTERQTVSRFPAEKKFDSLAIVVGGLATDYCVRATVLDALQFKRESANDRDPKRIGVFAMTNAMRAVNLQPDDGATALAEMRAAGAILTTTDDIITGKAFALRER